MSTVMTTYVARHEPCGAEMLFTREAEASTWLKSHRCPKGVQSAGSIRVVLGMDPAYSVIPARRLSAARERQDRIEKLLG
jgi:hypothetical protein